MPLVHPLNPDDVVLSKSWGLSGGRIVRSNSRARSWTSYTLELMHLPTGIRAKGQVPVGVYNRSEIMAHRQALYHRLVNELEQTVRAGQGRRFQLVYGRLRSN